MKRREFIALLGGAAAAWSLVAQAQQPAKAPRIGMLYPGPQAAVAVRVESMLKGVRESGYLSPAQIELVLRVADNDPARIAPLAADIIKANVEAEGLLTRSLNSANHPSLFGQRLRVRYRGCCIGRGSYVHQYPERLAAVLLLVALATRLL